MNIQNFSSYRTENDNLNSYQDFSSRPISENNNSASHINIEQKQVVEDGDSLAISKESSVAAKRLEIPRETVSQINYGTNFSTKQSEDMEVNGSNQMSNDSPISGRNTDDVLNQYRFFVQSYQYQDADGAVKRIFR